MMLQQQTSMRVSKCYQCCFDEFVHVFDFGWKLCRRRRVKRAGERTSERNILLIYVKTTFCESTMPSIIHGTHTHTTHPWARSCVDYSCTQIVNVRREYVFALWRFLSFDRSFAKHCRSSKSVMFDRRCLTISDVINQICVCSSVSAALACTNLASNNNFWSILHVSIDDVRPYLWNTVYNFGAGASDVWSVDVPCRQYEMTIKCSYKLNSKHMLHFYSTCFYSINILYDPIPVRTLTWAHIHIHIF